MRNMPVTADMVEIPNGTLVRGSEDFYPEERPVGKVPVSRFRFDKHPVTNAEFRRFIKDSSYITTAERAPSAEDFPNAAPEMLVPGSLVFTPTSGPVPLDQWHRWWRWQPGSDWRHPEGPGSTLDGRELHPVVHIAQEDALMYARWAGKRLPTEDEWEFAARGGLIGARYVWGEEFMPQGRVMANTWHGEFPWRNVLPRRHGRTTTVGTFPPNGYGLVDVVGNVWEWTATAWTASHADTFSDLERSCCTPINEADESARMVIKGGSHLCAASYCHRYRPAARQGQAIRSSTSHIGFRCAAVSQESRTTEELGIFAET